MNKVMTIGIALVMAAVAFAGLPANVAAAEDVRVDAIFPGYEVVVGKNVTFKWDKDATRKQRSFQLITSAGTINADSSAEEITWPNFPFGSGEWQVKIYNFKGQSGRIGITSKQNFYHYINVPDDFPGMQNAIPESFAYKKGARNLAQSRDLTIFYELTKDYSIDIASYFTVLDNLPKTIDGGIYNKTEDQRKDLYDHIMSLNSTDADFISLKDGFLTLKKGYRWDGTSNPFVWDEEPGDLRSSCVHDAFYDLMRMNLIDPNTGVVPKWNDPGYMNRLVADTMHYFIALEDDINKSTHAIWSDWRTLRKLGQAKTHKDKLLRAFKYRVSGLTAWVSEDGGIDLHWLPANKADDDPKDYHLKTHQYDIYRTKYGSDLWSSEWAFMGSVLFTPDDMGTHADETVYYTDNSVINGETYYYQIRANDLDTDGDGWTDQEEDDYGLGVVNFLRYDEKHYDESDVEAVTVINGTGNALQLNGTTNYVEADSVSTEFINVVVDLDSNEIIGGSLTFEAWVYPETQGHKAAILGFNKVVGGNYNLLFYDGAGKRFCYYDDANGYVCNTFSQIDPGQWYHVAVTINDSNQGTLFVNGVPEATFTTTIMPERNAFFSIGQEWDGPRKSQWFKGKVDEVRIWDYARTQTEIDLAKCSPMRGYHEGMVALWNFDEPPLSRKAYDTTIHSNDGTLVGYNALDIAFVPSNAMLPSVISAQDINIQLDGTGNAYITPAQVNSSVDGTCGIESMSVSQSSFTCGDVGPNTVTLTVFDTNGNVSTADAIVTVEDNVAPMAVAQDITVQLDAAGNAVTTPEQVDAGSSDACGIESITVSPSSFTCGDIGPNTVTLTVIDKNGNVSTDDATVTVEDNVAPIAVAQDITVQLDGAGNAFITAEQVDTGSSDACGIESITVSPSSFTCGDVGPNTVTLAVIDKNGNVGTADATVTVEDNIPPDISNVVASAEVLWPPNHKMVPVEIIGALISDNCGDIGLDNCKIVSVTSSEAINETGDGNTDPDYEVTGDLTVDLRAERSGSGTGRTYTITIECTDANENSSTATVDIYVPHDRGEKKKERITNRVKKRE